MPTPGSLSPPLQRHPGDGGAAVAAADDVDEAALSLRPVDGTLEVRWPARCRLDTQPLRGPNLRPARRPRAARSTPRVSPRGEFGAARPRPSAHGAPPGRPSRRQRDATRRGARTRRSVRAVGPTRGRSRPSGSTRARLAPAPATGQLRAGPQYPVRAAGLPLRQRIPDRDRAPVRCASVEFADRRRALLGVDLRGSVEELGGYRSGQPRPSDALAAKSATAADRQRPWRTVARPDPLRWDVEANGVLRVRFRTTFVFPSGFGEHESLVAGCGRPRTGATRA